MRIFQFPSKSTPDGPPHETVVHDDGRIDCGCPGFLHRGTCWHIEDQSVLAARDSQQFVAALNPIKLVPKRFFRVRFRLSRRQVYDDVGVQWNEIGVTESFAEAWLGLRSHAATFGADNVRVEQETTIVLIGEGAV